MYNFRVGHGYDVHKLVVDRKLVIGGVEIPFEFGLLGHSDADVLIHAVMDALLGSLGLGDIGMHFPDTDNAYKDISSIELLKKVKEIIKDKKASIVNIDATVVLQRPKISPYISLMKNNIAAALDIDPNCVNIKATTEEGLGFTGRKEGISAHSVVLVVFE